MDVIEGVPPLRTSPFPSMSQNGSLGTADHCCGCNAKGVVFDETISLSVHQVAYKFIGTFYILYLFMLLI